MGWRPQYQSCWVEGGQLQSGDTGRRSSSFQENAQHVQCRTSSLAMVSECL